MAAARTNLCSAGQVTCRVSSTTNYVNYSGWLSTHSVLVTDVDSDGLSDELDPDDDNDGLYDWVEQQGAAFDPAIVTLPNVADTDSDGWTDGQEAAAGTDPTDPLSYPGATPRGTLFKFR